MESSNVDKLQSDLKRLGSGRCKMKLR